MGTVSFIAVLGIGTFTDSYSSQADHGRPPALQIPDYAPTYSVDDYNNMPNFDHGRPPMVNNHADL